MHIGPVTPMTLVTRGASRWCPLSKYVLARSNVHSRSACVVSIFIPVHPSYSSSHSEKSHCRFRCSLVDSVRICNDRDSTGVDPRLIPIRGSSAPTGGAGALFSVAVAAARATIEGTHSSLLSPRSGESRGRIKVVRQWGSNWAHGISTKRERPEFQIPICSEFCSHDVHENDIRWEPHRRRY